MGGPQGQHLVNQKKKKKKNPKGHHTYTSTISSVMYDCNGEHLASISVRRDLIVHDFAPGGSTWTIKALKFVQWLEQELLNSNIQMGRLFG